ncbi:hypothetical protein QBC38DRAFT_64625 [Podospora fimiseda]|uniref:F-box domain-containing protein n=1 Tax=Podospora fimiseda TaxID=252190 RepID=A0AAN6YU26_9PEZI|nr:hypothetical protein QBC38DRAFT_64625 [Podospora fimiseda]
MISQTPIESLPNELLIELLSLFPTRELLPLTAVSRHFYSITLDILKQRLICAISLPDHRLILECYQPSARLSTPYLYCDYLYTDNALYAQEDKSGSFGQTLSSLRHTYSHFRPVVQEENKRPRARYPPRVAQPKSQSAKHEENGDANASSSSWQLETVPSVDISLDVDEMFAQLCTTTNLVKMGPKPGLFVSHINLSDGLIRVKRDWLAANLDDADRILWADPEHTVGVRFSVQENKSSGTKGPVLLAEWEEAPVEYQLNFEELVVRTLTLLNMVEKSEDQEIFTEGNAVVIASF